MAPKQPNYFDQAADFYQSAGGTYDQLQGGFGGPPTIYQSMNQYLNPYTNQVVNRAQRALTESRDRALNQVGADATAAGAFGGSRHGLVESDTYGNFADTEADMLAQLYQQRFDTAAGLGAQDVGNELTSRGINANAMMGGAAGIRGLGDTMYQQGVTGMNTAMQYGTMAQQMQQRLADLAGQDFATQQNWPFMMYQFLQGAAANNPLMKEMLTTGKSKSESSMTGEQTTTSTPSLTDIFGDLMSMASGFPGFGGGGAAAAPAAPAPVPTPTYSTQAPVVQYQAPQLSYGGGYGQPGYSPYQQPYPYYG